LQLDLVDSQPFWQRSEPLTLCLGELSGRH